MIYILTEDFFLYNGIKTLITSDSLKWLNNNQFESIALDLISNDDVVVIDTRIDSLLLFNLIKKIESYPYLIFLKDKIDIPVGVIISYGEVLDLNSPLSKISYIIMACQKNQKKIEEQNCLLSSREFEIMNLLIEGVCVKKISESFSIKDTTVYAHKRSICQKLGVSRLNHLLPYKYFVRLKMFKMNNKFHNH